MLPSALDSLATISSGQALSAMAVAAGVTGLLNSAELIAGASRLHLDQLLSWQVGRAQRYWVRHPALLWLADRIFAPAPFRAALVLRAAGSAALIPLALTGHPAPALIWLVFVLTCCVGVRSPFGLDGAYQMSLIVLAALALAYTVPAGHAHTLAIWFVAAQLGLAYTVAGVSKLSSGIWRSGSGLPGIMSTGTYGHPWAYAVLGQHRSLQITGSWAVIGFECAFAPLCLISHPTALVALAAGVAFHAANAMFMGLNNFFLAFLSAYPAMLAVSSARIR